MRSLKIKRKSEESDMANPIKIVYACNDGYFDGLYLSILSILRRTKQTINFYLLSANCTDINSNYLIMSSRHVDILNDLVKKFNSQNSFTLIDCKNNYEKFIKGGKNDRTKFSPYATFRLLLDEYEQFFGKIIYLDVDTMACGDIIELYNQNIDGYDFGAVIDRLGRIWHGSKCFNNGVLLLNMDEIRKSSFFKRTLKILFEKKMHFCDQTAMRKAKPNFIYLPKKFNEQKDISSNTVIKHFCARFKGWPLYHNIKQWNLQQKHRIKGINFFEKDYAIFLEAKKTFN